MLFPPWSLGYRFPPGPVARRRIQTSRCFVWVLLLGDEADEDDAAAADDDDDGAWCCGWWWRWCGACCCFPLDDDADDAGARCCLLGACCSIVVFRRFFLPRLSFTPLHSSLKLNNPLFMFTNFPRHFTTQFCEDSKVTPFLGAWDLREVRIWRHVCGGLIAVAVGQAKMPPVMLFRIVL